METATNATSRSYKKKLYTYRRNKSSYYFICYESDACQASIFDFCISVLNCMQPSVEWKIYQAILEDCGWIFPFENACLVCDRPIKISFDNQNRLHAEGEPAILFSGGFCVYAYHGINIPKKYGKLHPNQWDTKWLLEADNAELRQILIQELGYIPE